MYELFGIRKFVYYLQWAHYLFSVASLRSSNILHNLQGSSTRISPMTWFPVNTWTQKQISVSFSAYLFSNFVSHSQCPFTAELKSSATFSITIFFRNDRKIAKQTKRNRAVDFAPKLFECALLTKQRKFRNRVQLFLAVHGCTGLSPRVTEWEPLCEKFDSSSE